MRWSDLIVAGEVFIVDLGDGERIEMSIDQVSRREIGMELFDGNSVTMRDHSRMSMLACLTPGQARSLAVCLLAMAETIDDWRAKA